MTEKELEAKRLQLLGGSYSSSRGTWWHGNDNHKVAAFIAASAAAGRPVSLADAARACSAEPTAGFTDPAIVSIMDILGKTNWRSGIQSGKLNSMGDLVPKSANERVTIYVRDWREGAAFPKDLVQHWAELNSAQRFSIVVDPTGPEERQLRPQAKPLR